MAQQKKRKPKVKLPARQRVPIILDTDALDALEDAHQVLFDRESALQADRARRVALAAAGGDQAAAEQQDAAFVESELAPLRATVTAARKAVADATDTYVMQAVGRRRYHSLLEAHPPRDADHEKVRQHSGDPKDSAQFNADTFPPALFHACCVSHELTPAEVAAMFDEWNEAEFGALFAAAVAVNTTRRVAPMEAHGGR